MNKAQRLSTLAVMKEYFDRSTKVLDEADSGFTPKEGMFSTAEQVAHTAQTIDWFFSGAFAPGGFDMNFKKHQDEVRSVKSLQDARAWLERAFAQARAASESYTDAEWAQLLPPGPIMGGQPRFTIFPAVMEHTAHHRGALTVYSRLLGKVPPMPYGD